jgi:putative transposase
MGCRPSWGVESICTVLGELGVSIAPSTYYDSCRSLASSSASQQGDEVLLAEIRRTHGENYGVYGTRKVWLALNREGIAVARCTVERLMSQKIYRRRIARVVRWIRERLPRSRAG